MSGSTGIATNLANAQHHVFRITDIPLTMQYQCYWPVAARLMRRWFSSPRYELPHLVKINDGSVQPPSHALDQTTVTMGWALRFARVRVAHDLMVASWDSPNGRSEVLNAIKRSRQPGDKPWRLGDFTKTAAVVDRTSQVNFRPVGSLLDPLDDFYGAIGRGLLKIAVTGMVTNLPGGRYRIEIDEIATYLRDTYDFNDDSSKMYSQPLGFWGWTGVEKNPQLRWDIAIDEVTARADTPHDRLYAVQNDDFRAYRSKYGYGGDFVIYSDLNRIKLPRPKELIF